MVSGQVRRQGHPPRLLFVHVLSLTTLLSDSYPLPCITIFLHVDLHMASACLCPLPPLPAALSFTCIVPLRYAASIRQSQSSGSDDSLYYLSLYPPSLDFLYSDFSISPIVNIFHIVTTLYIPQAFYSPELPPSTFRSLSHRFTTPQHILRTGSHHVLSHHRKVCRLSVRLLPTQH
jgi:hypothetical protein